MRKFLKPFSFLPALLLMYMIYSFSAQEAQVSSEISYKVSYKIVQTADYVLDAGLEEWEMQSLATRFNGITRKLAHMTEYFALAIAVSFPLYVYGMHGILLMLTAGLICVGFACGDEYHQSFVAGRGPSVRDVFIDSFGVFWGIVLVRIIGWTGRKTIFRPLKKKKKRNYDHYSDSPENRRTAHSKDNRTYSSRSDYAYSQEPYSSRSYDQEPYSSRSGRSYSQEPYNVHSDRRVYDDRPSQRYPSYHDNGYTQREVEEAHVSDKLSEDLSFRKLMHDIKEQHREEKH